MSRRMFLTRLELKKVNALVESSGMVIRDLLTIRILDRPPLTEDQFVTLSGELRSRVCHALELNPETKVLNIR